MKTIINKAKLPGSFSVDNDEIINVKLSNPGPQLSDFDKEFITLGTNSKTLKEAINKINTNKSYQADIVYEYNQDMLDYLLYFAEEA